MNARVWPVFPDFHLHFSSFGSRGLLWSALLLPALALGQTPSQSNYTPYTFSTLAGRAGIGSVDGTGSSAQFALAVGVVVDSQGNAYVADTGNDTIRKIAPGGVVTTLAGSPGNSGSADGTGGAARFSSPLGIAIDSAGTLYVTDARNCTIRKITAGGVVTTLAGSPGNSGYIDGTGSAARFLLPFGVTLDSAGNVYVSDARNNTIRKVTPTGVVTTLAGVGMAPSAGSADGTGGDARFSGPRGAAVDGSGNVYVADTSNNVIRKISPTGEVTTLAGTAGTAGGVDGTGAAAQFNQPQDVAVDSSGNVYVADSRNDTIRKITAAGVVTTLAGTGGTAGTADGTGTAAQFSGPTAVAVDSSGNLFVSDTNNHTIRKVTSAGVVTTLAGTAGTAGNKDATGTAAMFASPIGVAVDSAGNVYTADAGSASIRKITSAGVVTTLAGFAGATGSTDGTGDAARFNAPQGIDIDSAGNVYVSDSGNSTIRKITAAGVVTTVAGVVGIRGTADGTGTAAEFSFPIGLAVDSAGNIYVADANNNMIRKISSAGVVTTLAGAPTNAGWADGTGSAAQFNNPAGMTVDSANNLYVADTGNNTIRKITLGGTVSTVAGSATDRSNLSRDGQLILARFNGPTGVAIDGTGNLYVADTGNSEIRLVTPAGIVSTLAGSPGWRGLADGPGAAALLNEPEGLAVDGAGNIYVADTFNNAIRFITPAGSVTTLAGARSSRGSSDGTGGAARFNSPRGTAVDNAGNVYVADAGNQTIRMVTPAGLVTTLAGQAGVSGGSDGTGTAARFSSPSGVAVDGSGNVYVADAVSQTIRKIAPGGVVTTLAGAAATPGSTNDTGNLARFSSPSGVAVDGSGNVYVADSANSMIRKVTSAGVVTTLAGAAGTSGSTDGTGTAAQFNSPSGVAVDGSGNVYVADAGNQTIRMITSAGVVTTLAGTAGTAGSTDGTGTAARFNSPSSLTVDGAGNVYVADAGNGTIRLIRSGGVVTTLAGTAGALGYADGAGSAARFSNPHGVAVDSTGNVYVGDIGNNTIRKITPAGVVSTLAGSALSASIGGTDGVGSNARFNEPNGVAVDSSGSLYIADIFNSTIRKVSPDGTVTTLAGTAGSRGSVDGTGVAAGFAFPHGVAVDNSGNVFVADTYNDTIRKITSDGTVTTLAGTAGVAGSADATGAAAAFSTPMGVAVDGSGNVYVADTGNSTIRKVTSDGVVTTLAGIAGSSGAIDATGSAARFSGPRGVAVDGAGNVYVADTGNQLIRKVGSGGNVTTLAGSALSGGSKDGVGVNAWFNVPVSVAVDGAGNVYVVDNNNNLIRRVTSAGVVTTLAGTAGVTGSADGTGSAALFNSPGGVATDGAGNIYVADTFNNTIRKGVSSGSGSTSTGSASGSGSSGSSDTGGSGSSGTGGSGTSGTGSGSGTSGGTGGSGTSGTGTSGGAGSASQFLYPAAVAEDGAGNLYVADASANVIRRITTTGVISTLAGSAGVGGMQDGMGTAALFNQPSGVAVDGMDNVYVTDTGNAVIRKITPAGVVTTLAGTTANRGNIDGTGPGAQFNYPIGLAADLSANLYVADAYANTIRKITPAGVVTTLAGTASTRGDADGTGSAALFNYPSGLAVDAAGNVFVADTYNDTIRKITAAGVVSTLAGSAGISGSNNGTGVYGLFNQPVGLATDGSGNVFVADTSNGSIRKITSGGVVTTVAGMAGIAALNDGPGANAMFNQPRGLVVDVSGTIYVADTGNAVIRRITPDNMVTTLALTAASTSTTPSASSPGTGTAAATGSSGGGGAMESWLVGALVLLGTARWLKQKSRRQA